MPPVTHDPAILPLLGAGETGSTALSDALGRPGPDDPAGPRAPRRRPVGGPPPFRCGPRPASRHDRREAERADPPPRATAVRPRAALPAVARHIGRRFDPLLLAVPTGAFVAIARCVRAAGPGPHTRVDYMYVT